MSIRNLEALFQPQSIALIGASDRPGSVGSVVLRNLKGGGFKGPIWPVNPRHATIDAGPAWPDVASLPEIPDLAVICTPAHTVPDLVAELGRKGARASSSRPARARRWNKPCSPPPGLICCAFLARTASARWCPAWA